MSANRQWKVVDERFSGNVFTDDHWYSTHIPRIVPVRTTQTTQKYVKQRNTAQTFTRSRVLSCSKPGIAQSTDTANIGAQLRRFHVRKTDEMRKSLMYHVRLEICAWFMRLREFWAVWLGLYVNGRMPFNLWEQIGVHSRAPSQYKDRLIYVWRFPC